MVQNFEERKDYFIENVFPPIGGAASYENTGIQGGKINIGENIDFIEKAATQFGVAGLERGNMKFIESFASPNGEAKKGEKNLGGAGKNKEKILLNVLTFKKFCMIAGTKKSHKIYDYYIKMELVLYNFLHKKIKEQNKKLELKDKKLELKDKQKEKNLTENFDNKPVVYLISIEKDVVMFGYTNDIKRRLGEHKHDIGKHIRLEHCVHSIYNREIESNIKKSIDLYTLVLDSVKKQIIKKSRIFSKEYREKNQTELIRIDKEFTLEKLFKLVTSVREKINYVEVVDKLNISNMQLLNVIKELKVV